MPLRENLFKLCCSLHPRKTEALRKGTLPIIQAPGDIEKPKLESKPRGRPPLVAKTKGLEGEKEK